MKKAISAICCLLMAIALLAGCTTNKNGGGDNTNPPAENPTSSKHLVLDAKGNYGGTLDEALYGVGAPLNGEYDHTDSGYYAAADFYNLKSTKNRTLIPNFAPYQQTMADSDGIACAMMIMNYSGDDIVNTYDELTMVTKYENLNNAVVHENGTTVDGLVTLFSDLGYTTRTGKYYETATDTNTKTADFVDWVTGYLKKGQVVMVRFQDGMKFGWHIIIGVDTLGSDYARAASLIMADPCDNIDHCQDGYYTSSAARFYRWWQNSPSSGVISNQFEYIVVAPNKVVNIERVEEQSVTNTVPELQLLLNADGSYGGTRDAAKYGTIPEKDGETNHLDTIYYAFPDYFNMQSTSTRSILSGYRAFQQTMASSCGICSALSVLNYYGEDIKTMDEVWLVDKYESLNGTTVKGSGIGSTGLNKLVTSLGYTADAGSYSKSSYVDRNSMCYPTYESFLTWVQGNLSKGTPLPISCRMIGGHWEVIIGIDTMGTDYIYDDVLVLADSHDTWDHYQDGYNTLPATMFYGQWFNGSFSYNQQHCVFDKKAA